MKPASLLRVATLALIWGSGFLWIKISLRGFTPIQLTWGRLALGALVLAVIVFTTGRRMPTGRTVWAHLVVAALLANAIPYLLFGIAEQDVDSALAGAINATTPLWTVALALAFRTTRSVTGTQLLGLGLGFAGALLIFAPWTSDHPDGHVAGALLCLIASASYGASYVYMSKYLANSGLTPIVLSAAQLAAATGWLSIALPTESSTPSITWRLDSTMALLVLGAVGTGIAYVLNYRIIADDGPVIASTVTYMLPIVAVLLGALVLGERTTGQMILGIMIVLCGVALTRRPARADTYTEQPRRRFI